MLAQEFNLIAPSSSQGGAAVLVIVNGPVVDEIGMNSGANLFGPGNRANATIGRAIRLILMNACASIPGLFDRTVIGHPGKYNVLHRRERDRLRLAAATRRRASARTRARSRCSPHGSRGRCARRPTRRRWCWTRLPTLLRCWAPPCVVGLGRRRLHAGLQGELVVTIGGAADFWGTWTKRDVREYLHPRIARSIADLKIVRVLEGDVGPADYQNLPPLRSRADDILVVRAGSPEATGYRCSVILSELPKVAVGCGDKAVASGPVLALVGS